MSNPGINEQLMFACMPATLDALSVSSGYSRGGTWQWVKRMREEKRVYISGYQEDSRGRMIVSIYAKGNKPDAPRVGQRFTSADRMRKARARKHVEAR